MRFSFLLMTTSDVLQQKFASKKSYDEFNYKHLVLMIVILEDVNISVVI